jgi:hypothetical protein
MLDGGLVAQPCGDNHHSDVSGVADKRRSGSQDLSLTHQQKLSKGRLKPHGRSLQKWAYSMQLSRLMAPVEPGRVIR